MNNKYLEAALQRIPSVEILINVISKRVRQLTAHQKPLVELDGPSMSLMDIALKEVSEGKIGLESESDAEEAKSERKKKK